MTARNELSVQRLEHLGLAAYDLRVALEERLRQHHRNREERRTTILDLEREQLELSPSSAPDRLRSVEDSLRFYRELPEQQMPQLLCSCDYFARRGLYYHPGGAITFHLRCDAQELVVFPLHRQYLPPGEYDFQSVECDCFIERPDRDRLAEEILRYLRPLNLPAQIVWTIELAKHRSP